MAEKVRVIPSIDGMYFGINLKLVFIIKHKNYKQEYILGP
jgi:hypothetical protein